jgi:hypothetical protein
MSGYREILKDKKIPNSVKEFIIYTLQFAKQKRVKVIFSRSRLIKKCNGFFETKPNVLAVACGQEFNKWFSIFIHESSHMDQWAESSSLWTHEKNDSAALDSWIEGKKELSNKELQVCIDRIRDLELDCERRAIQKIKKWNLPIDTETYIKKANSYVFFYNFLKENRAWYKKGKEPYNNEEVWMNAPGHFNGDYSSIPRKLKIAYKNLTKKI